MQPRVTLDVSIRTLTSTGNETRTHWSYISIGPSSLLCRGHQGGNREISKEAIALIQERGGCIRLVW